MPTSGDQDGFAGRIRMGAMQAVKAEKPVVARRLHGGSGEVEVEEVEFRAPPSLIPLGFGPP